MPCLRILYLFIYLFIERLGPFGYAFYQQGISLVCPLCYFHNRSIGPILEAWSKATFHNLSNFTDRWEWGDGMVPRKNSAWVIACHFHCLVPNRPRPNTGPQSWSKAWYKRLIEIKHLTGLTNLKELSRGKRFRMNHNQDTLERYGGLGSQKIFWMGVMTKQFCDAAEKVI